jgi:hypothetical protein
MIKATDKLTLKGKAPTPAEIRPPIPICMNPSRAEALPAFFLNGLSAIAAAFG